MQYTEFLHSAMPLEDYTAVLPSLSSLIADYAVPTEVAFALWRPILRALEPEASPSAKRRRRLMAGPEEGELPEEGEAEDAMAVEQVAGILGCDVSQGCWCCQRWCH
jgi:hypothetical protein